MSRRPVRPSLRPERPSSRSARSFRKRVLFVVLVAGTVFSTVVSMSAAGVVLSAAYHVCCSREDLPDLGPFTRFEFSSVGRIYDTHGQPIVELAREYRDITPYTDIPPIVRDAILAAEDKRFFSHNGPDYRSMARMIGKVRVGTWAARLSTGAWRDDADGRAIFPQGGSTITQQLVRGVFLQHQTSQENSTQLRTLGLFPRTLASVTGARNVNMLLRKSEEIRLSLWIEQQMRERFGSKRRAKEEILARYASFLYMGNGQYGFARAAEYYFGQSLGTFTADDADRAALLAGIAKSPRDYAPTAKDPAPILRRRNQILALMAEAGFISPDQMTIARARPLPGALRRASRSLHASAVVQHVLDELTSAHPDLGSDDLLLGRLQVYTTVDARGQRLVSDALEHGLARYEQRHPSARGIVQGAVVVLRNRDGSILAETGGRQIYRGRATSPSDFNRVRQSLRQPGSTMKPLVYLAAFQRGRFSLDTLVPDAPISVPGVRADLPKWIANYDGRFKGLIPIRAALAESRNAVAIWITAQIGIDVVLRTSRDLGVQTRLRPYASTALGASEVNLLELATAYRAIASGIAAEPYVIRRIVDRSGDVIPTRRPAPHPIALDAGTLGLIQEGLRGVVRLPTGTAHALDSRAFPIAVMGKTGTTNDFKDALFIGSTYGADGVTVAVRIGFDDSRSLGGSETGGRVALPVFQEIMLRIYQAQIAGPAPAFPNQIEQRITRYLQQAPVDSPDAVATVATATDGVGDGGQRPGIVARGTDDRPPHRLSGAVPLAHD